MSAATIAIDTPERAATVIQFPVAADTKIFAGTLVAINAAGNALPASDTAALLVVGRAEEDVDNTDGAIGDLTVNVKRGCFRYDNSETLALTKADVGQFAYVEDDSTVAVSSDESIVAGVLVEVDDDGAWVYIPATVLTVGTVANGAVTTAKIADANVTPAKTNIVEARTATVTGATTGTIGDTSTHVTVTSDSADKIIVLPTPTPGRQVVINNGATGYELRSSDPATIAINGGSGANAESAIAANSTVIAICISATAWKAIFLDADSDVAKVEAAAA